MGVSVSPDGQSITDTRMHTHINLRNVNVLNAPVEGVSQESGELSGSESGEASGGEKSLPAGLDALAALEKQLAGNADFKEGLRKVTAELSEQFLSKYKGQQADTNSSSSTPT